MAIPLTVILKFSKLPARPANANDQYSPSRLPSIAAKSKQSFNPRAHAGRDTYAGKLI
ncbi:hypothetical protein [Methylomonas albis]|uniref:Uncharacterized protein n=1 Tax=Methylomonas albis TaxID=1854563 RepID=A0ABR9D5I2_9GAMM|nr:hypothetical protein [Methylomonas albis]MBD9358382.1 hypothetical protein [Methylomonas albis]